MGINVLSLFDGMSCGQIALDRLGVEVDNYFASEIDKYAMKIAKKNYPNMEHIGDVREVTVGEYPKIDLLIGGSPCQGFSFAGKQLNFEDPRSKLFFEFMRLLEETKPKYFLLENVKMKKESQDIISKYLGVEPIEINSALISAQNRKRLYWTDIPNIDQPENKGINIRDILEDSGDPFNYSSSGRGSGIVEGRYTISDKSLTLTRAGYSNRSMTGVLDTRCLQVGKADMKGTDMLRRIYSILGKCPTLTTMSGGHQEKKIALNNNIWRKLTPLECERLQTVPDNYTEGVSKTQRYNMLGNGWTVDVIAHILKNMEF
jgi:DNA (cytosine-5)-methyltransferase 3A